MKSILQFCLVIAGIGLFGNGKLNAQSASGMTGTIVTQPCNNNGQIAVTVTAALTPPLSFTLNNWMANTTVVQTGVTTMSTSFAGLGAYQGMWGMNPNFWQVTASDGVNTAWISLSLTPPFIDTIQVTPAVCPSLNTLQAVSFFGGTPPYVCVWTNTTSSLNYSANPAQVPSGNYSVVITDGAGCVVSSVVGGSTTINVSNIPTFSLTMSGSAANCTNGTASVTSVSGGISPYTYLWSNNAVSQSISGLVQGAYNCVVTDAIGCQSTGFYFVSQSVAITFNTTVTNATCIQNNGSVMSFVSGGTSPYTFSWSNGATTQNISGLTSGLYSVLITDAVGCTRNAWVNVNASTPVNVTYNATASSCTAATGSATLVPTGGASPYSVIWYTFPSNSTGLSISGRPSGNYAFKVTDANGCIRNGQAIIPSVSTLTLALNAAPVMCPATTGNVIANASGTNPPFTYLWSNNATTSSINGVALGGYNCTVTDAVGCSITKSKGLMQYSPVNIGYSVTPASCIFAADGVAMANASGGTGPYTYQWNTSQTGSTITGLITGNYKAVATDANGCTSSNNTNAYVGYNANNNSCYCIITGTVFADANANCTRDGGEAGINGIGVHCSGYGVVYTNANGVYSFKVPSGSYTVTEYIQQNYPLASCQTNNQVVSVSAGGGCTSVVNFANTVVPVHDLQIITTNMNQPVPGNNYQQKVIVRNNGTILQNSIQIGYKHDGQLSFNNSTPWAFVQPNTAAPTWYRINSGFPSLAGGAASTAFINYNVPTNIPLGTQVNFLDTVARQAPIPTSWLSDVSPWDNVNACQAIVVASYDPNFKEVSPKGVGAQGGITRNDSTLNYVVHFQNEGTYFAQNVVVVDTLDQNLNFSSLRPGYGSHNYTVSVSDQGVMRFHFNNINLPWKSQYGDVASSGMFTYSVRLKKNLAIGTKIKNTAAIYFDYNAPIITNTTLNTLIQAVTDVGMNELKGAGVSKLMLYPNPTKNNFDILCESKQESIGSITIFDLSGRVLTEKTVELKTGENTLSGNTENLQSGLYIVQLKAENTVLVGKLIVTK